MAKPTAPLGIEVEVCVDTTLCRGCGNMLNPGEYTFRHNSRGASYRNNLPGKNGICAVCAANSLSIWLTDHFHKSLENTNARNELAEKAEHTPDELALLKGLDSVADTIERTMGEVGELVAWCNSNPPQWKLDNPDAQTPEEEDFEADSQLNEEL